MKKGYIGALFASKLVLALTSSAGCGNVDANGADDWWSKSFTFDSVDYDHWFALPEDYDVNTPVSLLLYFHGWGGGSSMSGLPQ